MRSSVVALLAAILAAGCASTPPPDADTPPPASGPVLLTPVLEDEAAPVLPSSDDLFELPLEASAEGAIRAFALDVPTGATVEAWHGYWSLPIIEYAFLDPAM